jgi:hypothetical protein
VVLLLAQENQDCGQQEFWDLIVGPGFKEHSFTVLLLAQVN